MKLVPVDVGVSRAARAEMSYRPMYFCQAVVPVAVLRSDDVTMFRELANVPAPT
jgi:hypothetical protein